LARKRQDSFSQRPFLSTLELLASRQAIVCLSILPKSITFCLKLAGSSNRNIQCKFGIGSQQSRRNRFESTIEPNGHFLWRINNEFGNSTDKKAIHNNNNGNHTTKGNDWNGFGVIAKTGSQIDPVFEQCRPTKSW
jgi:hypothetical protein